MPKTTKPNDKTADVEYLQWLAESGQTDVLNLNRETAEQVLTEKRMEIVETISNHEISSVRSLAERLDRDVSIVSRDLDVLFEAEVIDFEENGRAKKPVLAHETIIAEPIVFNGTVMDV